MKRFKKNIKTKGGMSKVLTGIKDVDILTLLYLDDRDLFNFCRNGSKNKYVYTICSDENLWYRRFMNKYGRMKVGNQMKESEIVGEMKDPSRTWRNFYLKATYYIDKFEKKEFSKEEVSKEKDDLIAFLKYYLGYISLKNIVLENFVSLRIYTGLINDKEFPDFPYGKDIITISKVGENYSVFSEQIFDSDDENENQEEKFTKNGINLFLEKLMFYYPIQIIERTFYFKFIFENIYDYRNYFQNEMDSIGGTKLFFKFKN